mmetsp:Transcript_103023/g.204463  ORF Transcript_103023/g.204463 Transcript_103023/m.204463 type:complete len:250 (+) Transcript_103023:79-828(+)
MAPLCLLVFTAISFRLRSVLGELNVYGNAMADCGTDHATGCTYSSMDSGAHQVCVTSLPSGFSSDTGQGRWSDEYTGQPWCICIWAYSNYILQQKDLPLKCKAIPAKVLEEQYSLDKFKQCGSMSSTAGCGPEDIRRSIQSLCQQCVKQAGSDQDAKDALKTKCDAILQSAPAAPMKLYDGAPPELSSTPSKGVAELSSLSSWYPAFLGLVIGSVALGLTVRMCSRRRNKQTMNDEVNDEEVFEHSILE